MPGHFFPALLSHSEAAVCLLKPPPSPSADDLASFFIEPEKQSDKKSCVFPSPIDKPPITMEDASLLLTEAATPLLSPRSHSLSPSQGLCSLTCTTPSSLLHWLVPISIRNATAPLILKKGQRTAPFEEHLSALVILFNVSCISQSENCKAKVPSLDPHTPPWSRLSFTLGGCVWTPCLHFHLSCSHLHILELGFCLHDATETALISVNSNPQVAWSRVSLFSSYLTTPSFFFECIILSLPV